MSTITLAAIVFRLGLTQRDVPVLVRQPGRRQRGARTVQTTFTSVMMLSTLAVILGLIFLDPLAERAGRSRR